MAAEPLITAALYLRLSREDGDSDRSESIRSQQMQLMDYAASHGFGISAIYTDDGISGTKWERPSFQEMLLAAQHGQFQAILVKDLSRLSRDYIKTGELLEQWFPKYGVRLIAVDDGIDTAKRLPANEFSPVYALMNDWYARDISRKVRAAIYTRQQNGICTLAVLPYGYRRTAQGIVTVTLEAEVVRSIYRAYQNGESCVEIAKVLTKMRIPPPARMHTKWNDVTIGKILDNTAYNGKLMLHTTEKSGYKSGRKQRLSKQEWIPFPVPPIVSAELYQSVKLQREKRKYKRRQTHWLSGCVCCLECGNVMYISGGRLLCSGRKHGNGCQNPSLPLDSVLKMYHSILEADGITDIEKALPSLVQEIRIGQQTAEFFMRYQKP